MEFREPDFNFLSAILESAGRVRVVAIDLVDQLSSSRSILMLSVIRVPDGPHSSSWDQMECSSAGKATFWSNQS